MIELAWDLPFQIPLKPGTYECNTRGLVIEFAHNLKEQEVLDLRLGGIGGSFGLQRDNLGILRFSQLRFSLDDTAEQHILHAFRPELGEFVDHEDQQLIPHLAMLLCNHFLNKVRLVVGSTDVRPLKDGDLAHLEYKSAEECGKVRLYGGGIMLPIAGHSEETELALRVELADPDDPMPFELDSLDAIRAGRDGLSRESVILATGALESALDHYLSRFWRNSLSPSKRVPHAVSTLGLRTSKKSPMHFTVEDALRDAGVRKKFGLFADANNVDDRTRVGIERVIDSRNIVVHGGVSIPSALAERHANSVRAFLHHYLKPALDRIDSVPDKLEFLYAYEEATATTCSPVLERIAQEHLSNRGLTALLYHERSIDEGFSSDHFGTTLVMRVPFNDRRFAPQSINLYIARMIVHFGVRSVGLFAEAQVSDSLPFDDVYSGWSFVAREINKAVWDIAIDRVIRKFGFVEEIDADIQTRAKELTDFYLGSYAAPKSGEVRGFVEFMRLAGILSALNLEERQPLIKAAEHAASSVAILATLVLPFLDAVTFEQPDSILEALIRLHDADWRILASVVIRDPRTGKHFGRGLNP